MCPLTSSDSSGIVEETRIVLGPGATENEPLQSIYSWHYNYSSYGVCWWFSYWPCLPMYVPPIGLRTWLLTSHVNLWIRDTSTAKFDLRDTGTVDENTPNGTGIRLKTRNCKFKVKKEGVFQSHWFLANSKYFSRSTWLIQRQCPLSSNLNYLIRHRKREVLIVGIRPRQRFPRHTPSLRDKFRSWTCSGIQFLWLAAVSSHAWYDAPRRERRPDHSNP